MPLQQHSFIIIGGGVAGPVAALRLAQDGHLCTIYERAAKPTTIGGAVNIAPNGMRLINRLGVGDELRGAGGMVPVIAVQDENGACLGSFKNASRDGIQGIRIMRSMFQMVLLAEWKRKGFEVKYGKELESVEETESGITAHFTDGTNAQGDYLIGADGIHSKARSFVAPGVSPLYTGMSLVHGIVPTNRLPDVDFKSMPATCGIFARTGFFATAFTNQSRETIFWISAKRKEIAEKSDDAERIRAEEHARFQHLYDPIPRIIESTDEFFSWPVYELPDLQSWHRGRMVLVGDAAHALPPNQGQGVSQAIEDVFVLARAINEGKGFEAYERLRRPRVAKLKASIKSQTREYERGPWAQWLLTWVYWAFMQVLVVIQWAFSWDRFEYDPDKAKL